jgi:hypothetical protein
MNMSESHSAICQRVEGEVLRQCYARIYTTDLEVTTLTVSESVGVAHPDVDTICEGMVGKQLIERLRFLGAALCSLSITSAGIRDAEQRGVADAALVKEHRRVCEQILRLLYAVRTESGQHYPWHLQDDNGTDIPMWTLERVVQTLVVDRLVEPLRHLDGTYRITAAGIQQLHDWDDETAPALELVRIEDLRPQPRGTALEGVLAEALRRQGCRCEKNTGGKGEQIDLVVECGLGYYVCEAKWLKDRVQPLVVHHMKGRLDGRPSFAVGVIFSMSDFTQSAWDKAAHHAGQRTILLFGKDDTRAIIRGERTFEEMVRRQQRHLVTRGCLK